MQFKKYVNLDITKNKSFIQKLYIEARNYLFEHEKSIKFKECLQKSFTNNMFSLTVDRTKAAAMKNRGKVDHEGGWSVFGQLTRILRQK